MLTIVTTVYNRKDLFRETLNSVLNQTYQDFEYIIVDDGSTDGTVNMIESHEDKRIRLIKLPHTADTSKNLNTAVDAMKGNALCIIGSDDLWLNNKLERQVEFAKTHPNHVIHSRAVLINENGIPLYEDRAFDGTQEEYIERAKRPWGFFYGSSLFIPKHILDKVGKFNSFLDDYEWVVRSILKYNVKYAMVDEVLMKKRLNPKSISAERRDEIQTAQEEIRRSFI